MDNIGDAIKGYYRDLLTDSNGNILHDSGWHSNTIVKDCRILIARFMHGDSVKGNLHLKVGQGLLDWDQTMETPTVNITKLESPSLDDQNKPKEYIPTINFLFDNDEITTEPSSRLQLTVILGPGEPKPLQGSSLNSYPLREFGLFASQPSSDPYMINCVRHPRIDKDASATLVRSIRLYF